MEGDFPSNNITRAVHNNARHRMAVKKPVVIQRCDICNIELIGQVVIDAHLKGSKHAKKLKAQELLTNLIGAGQVSVPNDKPALFTCSLCKVSLNSSQQLEVHYAGTKHKAKAMKEAGEQSANVEKEEEIGAVNDSGNDGAEDPKAFTKTSAAAGVSAERPKALISNPLDLVCTVCNITVNSPQQLEQHLSSKKHQDREAGRKSSKPHRPGPYVRGGRGGLGSHGRGGKGIPSKFTSLSSSFKSAGYHNSFIKPEGGVIMPPNCGTSKDATQCGPSQPLFNKAPNFGQFKNRGNFGSLTPYVAGDGSSTSRGGFSSRGGMQRGGWVGPSSAYAPQSGYGNYEYDYGYNYTGYENSEGYGGYGMMQSGPPPSY